MSKVVILALTGPGHHADHQRAQRMTWASPSLTGETDVFWVRGVGSRGVSTVECTDDREILVPIEETVPNIFEKTRRAMVWLRSNVEFDYILRTNTSTYVIPALLAEMLERLPHRGLYAGTIGLWMDEELKLGWPFVSGADLLLSKDTLNHLIETETRTFEQWIDDVAIGRVFASKGVPCVALPIRTDISICEPLDLRPNLRLKHWTLPHVTTRRMYEVHEVLYGGPLGLNARLTQFDRRELKRASVMWRHQPWKTIRAAQRIRLNRGERIERIQSFIERCSSPQGS